MLRGGGRGGHIYWPASVLEFLLLGNLECTVTLFIKVACPYFWSTCYTAKQTSWDRPSCSTAEVPEFLLHCGPTEYNVMHLKVKVIVINLWAILEHFQTKVWLMDGGMADITTAFSRLVCSTSSVQGTHLIYSQNNKPIMDCATVAANCEAIEKQFLHCIYLPGDI